jgi:hypothetical protein
LGSRMGGLGRQTPMARVLVNRMTPLVCISSRWHSDDIFPRTIK